MTLLLTSEQAAHELGSTPNTLATWRHQGKGPKFIKIHGRMIRYRMADLIAWINQHGTLSYAAQQEPDPIQPIKRLRLKPGA